MVLSTKIVVRVHEHGYCSICRTNVDKCCQGEISEGSENFPNSNGKGNNE